jgi:hypothetical protein
MTAFIVPTNQSPMPKSVVNVIVRMKALYLEPPWVEMWSLMIDYTSDRELDWKLESRD